jgi:hypothetical protein
MPEIKATQKIVIEVVSVRPRWFRKPEVTLKVTGPGLGLLGREVNLIEKDTLTLENEFKQSLWFPPGTRIEFKK